MAVGERTRVLIVDGLRAVREGLSALLGAQDDFEVVGEAGSLPEAMDRALELRPDLVLLDVELPGGDGEHTLACLRDRGVASVVVALGLTGDAARQKRLTGGACRAYIQKGAQPEDVLRTVRAALDRIG